MLNATTINHSQLAGVSKKEAAGNKSYSEPSAEQCAQWVRLAKSGDRHSWDQLVAAFHTRIYHYLISFMGNAHDAQDVTQDTFIKVYRKLHQHREGSSFTSWIFTVARRTALNHFRDRKMGEELPEDLTCQGDSPSQMAQNSDDSQMLWNYVSHLKPAAKQALWLRYGDGHSIAEIAEIMGKTSLYIRVLLHRAKSDLAKKVKNHPPR